MSPDDTLLPTFQQFQKDYDKVLGFVIGNCEFWTKTVEHVAHQVYLKTLDFIIVSRFIFKSMISHHLIHDKKKPQRKF